MLLSSINPLSLFNGENKAISNTLGSTLLIPGHSAPTNDKARYRQKVGVSHEIIRPLVPGPLVDLVVRIDDGLRIKGPKLEAGPYLQSATPHDIWILWETSSGNQSHVMWGTQPDVLDFETTGQSERGFGKSRVHSVQLTELSPDTQYFYQVQTGQTQSDVYDFVTPPAPDAEQSFRLLAMSDMQRDSEYPRKFEAMVTKGIIPYVTESDEYDLSDSIGLTVIPGDLVMNGNDYDQWKDDSSGQVLTYSPMCPCTQSWPGITNTTAPITNCTFTCPKMGRKGLKSIGTQWITPICGSLASTPTKTIESRNKLDWLDQVLADTCQDGSIDFVFAQLHHPHESIMGPRRGGLRGRCHRST